MCVLRYFQAKLMLFGSSRTALDAHGLRHDPRESSCKIKNANFKASTKMLHKVRVWLKKIKKRKNLKKEKKENGKDEV